MSGSEGGAIESAAQLAGMWRALIEDVGATSRRADGLTYLWADSAFGFYNAISFGDPGVDQARFAARLDAARSFMVRSERNGFLWVFEELLTPETRDRADAIASSSGFERAMTCYGMAGDLPPLREPEHPSLSFQRVSTPDHLAAYASLNARAYGLVEEDAKEAMVGSNVWREGIYAFLGLENGIPVCCAGCRPVDDRLFVVLVATEPTAQRWGFGEAVTRKALFEASRATNLTRATLQATEAGRPVYERIGLQVTSRVSLLAPI